MMRADPDVIMVGEIRDRETAQIAVEAALTGHLVLSTLHTNDAPGAITRLIEMGIEPFLVSSAIDCVVAQRLARTLCEHCKKPIHAQRRGRCATTASTSTDGIEAYEPGGCARCGGSGYKGRLGLYEVMIVTDEIRRLAIERASADQIGDVAERAGHDAACARTASRRSSRAGPRSPRSPASPARSRLGVGRRDVGGPGRRESGVPPGVVASGRRPAGRSKPAAR